MFKGVFSLDSLDKITNRAALFRLVREVDLDRLSVAGFGMVHSNMTPEFLQGVGINITFITFYVVLL